MIRPEYYSVFDFDAIAEHLEKMAQRGWLLEKIGPFFWKYRRIGPEKLRYYVSYFPGASEFGPVDSPERGEYEEMAAHTGWRRCASMEGMEIFYSADADAVPVETDPVLRLLSVHVHCMRSIVPFAVCAVAAAILMLSTAAGTMTGSMGYFAVLAAALTGLYYGVELAVYGVWYCRARRAALAGETVRSPGHSAVLAALQWAALALLVGLGVGGAVLGSGAERLAGLLPVLAAAVMFSGVCRLRDVLRERGVPARRGRVVFNAAAWAVFLVLAAGAYAVFS